MRASENKESLVIVSNRLPVILNRKKNGQIRIETGAGGLVTAMAPILKNRGGTWIGWPGCLEEEAIDTADLLSKETKKLGYGIKPVHLDAKDIELYYKGFSNEVIWPLFHDFLDNCNFDPEYWAAYQSVNRKFAKVVYENIKKDDFIWIHDYHLMGVAQELRRMGVTNRIGFFLHIPFPNTDMFMHIPWRFQILSSLLDFDLVGFQTVKDRINFSGCVKRLIKHARPRGKGQVVEWGVDDRTVRLGAFPISIDFKAFSKQARNREVAEITSLIHKNLPDSKIILGVDRLDYTKGIIIRLKAFQKLLTDYPDLRGKVKLVQITVPSRQEILKYNYLKKDIERLVGEINGQFSRDGWSPIQYMYRSFDRNNLIAYYRACEIALITPIKDGMNLIAKEYCACNIDKNGILILSEFVGAVHQFHKNAIVVNPHDVEAIADALNQAFLMSEDEIGRRMGKLRQNVRKYDIFWWLDSFLKAAIEKDLSSFPVLEEYQRL
ncbi:MAG: trehalose-6-phosphate synthase [Spirochaetales bacterium]|nr:trehalose-6-phosphate synthase [Spirochaetales bacterium]